MKRKVVNAMLLGMAISLTMPISGIAAEEPNATEARQETTQNPEQDTSSGDSAETPAVEETPAGAAEDTGEEVSAQDAGGSEMADSYTDHIGKVLEKLAESENTEELQKMLSDFTEKHASEHSTVSEFVSAFLEDVEKLEDEVTILKAFGTVYDWDLNECVKIFIMGVVDRSTSASMEEKVVCEAELGEAKTLDDLWAKYEEWVAKYPVEGTGSEGGENGSGDNNEGEGGGETEGDNKENTPANAESAVKELQGFDMSALNDEKKAEAQAVIDEAVAKIGTCLTEDEVNAVFTDAMERLTQIAAPVLPDNAEAAIKELSELDYSSLSEANKEEARKMLESFIEKIGSCTTEEEVSDIVAEAKESLEKIMERDLLDTRIEVSVNELTKFYSELTFNDENSVEKAKEIYEAYVALLQEVPSENKIEGILEEAKTKLQDLASGTGEVLEETKATALLELKDIKDAMNDKEIAPKVYVLYAERIETAEDMISVEKYLSCGKESLDSLREALETDSKDSYANFLNSLKPLADNTDDKEILDYIMTALPDEKPSEKAADFLTALENKDITLYKKALINEIDYRVSILPEATKKKGEEAAEEAENALAREDTKKGAYKVYESTTQDLSKLNSANDELKDKIAENIEKLNNLTKLDTDEVKEIIRIYTEKLNEAESVEAADNLLKDAEEKIKKLEKNDEEAKKLTAAKEAAKKQLDVLLQGVTDTTLKADIMKIVDKYKSDIAIADTVEEINEMVKKAKDDVAKVKKDFEAEKALKAAKEKAKGQIDSFVNAVKDAELREQLTKIANSAKSDVENATDASAISSIITKFKDDVTTITKEYTENKALATKKTSTIQKITSYVSNKQMTSELTYLTNEAKNSIMAAKTASEVDTIYSTFLKDFNAKALEGVRNEYDKKLNDLLAGVSTSSPKYSEIQALINKAKTNVQNATSQELMESIYAQAQNNVSVLSQQGDEKNSLETIKVNAINSLKNATSLATDSAQKVISVYTNKIQNSSTEEEVNRNLEEGKALLRKLNEAAGLNADGTSPYESTTGTGNGATVNNGTMNRSDGSAAGNTAYTSTMKNDMGTGLKGDVKTGDENGLRIVASIIAIIGGLGAGIYFAIKKFRKK